MDYDDDMKKSVIDQMMGELDDVTADSLKKKPESPAKGVEIAITVSPKAEDAEQGADGDGDADDCMDMDCDDPMHDHSARDAEKGESAEGDGDYIQQLLKKLG